ncbi:hypothetical protein [Synechococcus sp. BA-132 BA5]|uniref:hypothetical protein n=1 Tax=Synechococcus sp. BA-132 BA5 TaxID=3110252 RepID=UPI002B21C450|nr:hypothetical protein [Synechococcus sp. BA-132 BA5]MEA5417440.1 hypothetical protein [Synechococcus sp. BA-132 BA5]
MGYPEGTPGEHFGIAKPPSTTDTEAWLQEVEALRSQLKGGPIPVDDLVADTERDCH